jgi:DNA-binding NarL/FixJ family response regulator
LANPVDRQEERRLAVLLVDDSQMFLDVAIAFLQRHDELLVVGAVLGGEEALVQAQELQPHVILIDLDMPGLAGLETIPRLRAMLPQAGIIALTLLSGSAYRQATLAAGGDDLVPKATMSTDLLPAIERAVQARQPEDGR